MIPLRDNIARIGIPLITWILIIVNGMIFVFEISIPKDMLEEIFYFFGLTPARYSSPQWALIHGLSPKDYLPFLTNMFLHVGWLHIIGNMWFLYIFGRSVEDRMGPVRFLIFYLLSGMVANGIFFIINPRSTIPELGASGAIAGVMGAYIVMFPNAKIITMILILFFPFFFELSAFIYIGFWFILQLFSGTLSFASPATGGGIAWWAHIGGFITGIVLVPLFRKRQAPRQGFPDEKYHYVGR
jgi:membrane associated rhomboid family serine protease